MQSASDVLALAPAAAHPTHIDLGVVGPYPDGSPVAFELRAFFTDHQGSIREDPVTGSLNASTAQWLLGTGRAAAPYVASQGTCIGHTGRIYIDTDAAGNIWVGGRSSTKFSGRAFI